MWRERNRWKESGEILELVINSYSFHVKLMNILRQEIQGAAAYKPSSKVINVVFNKNAQVI